MSSELEQEAEVLWEASEKYFGIACEHFYMDHTVESATESFPDHLAAEFAKGLPVGLHLPAGCGQEAIVRVHFLFPNLDQVERHLLSLILLYSDGADPPMRSLADYKSDFWKSKIMKKVTAVQMEIIEKKILRTS